MTDLEFVQKCVSGDKRSWDEFVDKYSRLIYRYIHSVFKLHGASIDHKSCAEDLFQEIFFSLIKDDYRKLKAFKSRRGSSLATWLRVVTVNCAIDYLRRLKVTVSLEEENEEGFSLKEVVPADPAPAKDGLWENEKLLNLADCVERLGFDDKYFMELHINQGLKLDEVMSALGISRGAADMRKSRIVNRLKDCFKEKGFSDAV